MTTIFLAMLYRNTDGTFTFSFWYVIAVGVLMAGTGIWCLAAPESMRVFYFNLLNGIRRQRGIQTMTPSGAWGWSSPAQIRLIGGVATALALGFMAWVAFFTTPGVAY